MSVPTIALQAIAEAADDDRDRLDAANELAIDLLGEAGVTMLDDPLLVAEIEDLQALLVEAVLRSPGLATLLERVVQAA